ncbi:phosphatidylserine decarboxylase [Rickettsiales bacterium LUAb2]
MHDFKLPKIAKEGYPFILIFLIITIVCLLFSNILGMIGLVLTVWCALFFRDPARITPQKKGLVISPADGVIQKISYSLPPKDLIDFKQEEMLKISIFMNVFNVHINRSPISGNIKTISYIPGKFVNASLDKASDYNERQSFIIETDNNESIVVVQIAGLIARRIVKFVEEGNDIKTGEKFGLIRFGSRVDVYLPKHVKPKVLEGQIAIGGETILADLVNQDTEDVTGMVLDRAPSNLN